MMSGQIQFVDECHINGVKFPKASIVNEADVPADWLVGAMRHGFVCRPSVTVPAVVTELVSNVPETIPEDVIPY
jgi:hypothetical protein